MHAICNNPSGNHLSDEALDFMTSQLGTGSLDSSSLLQAPSQSSQNPIVQSSSSSSQQQQQQGSVFLDGQQFLNELRQNEVAAAAMQPALNVRLPTVLNPMGIFDFQQLTDQQQLVRIFCWLKLFFANFNGFAL
jgi:hypothetical protein